MCDDGNNGDLAMRLLRFGHGQSRASSGQGLVEFALVFPIIVLLFFGIFDLGRGVFAYNTIANAARQGARVAAVNQLAPLSATTCAENMPVEDLANPHWSIKACAASAAVSLGIQTGAVSVTYAKPPNTSLSCSQTTLQRGCIASVTVAYTWTPSTPVIGNIIGPITMTSTSQIPIERVFP